MRRIKSWAAAAAAVVGLSLVGRAFGQTAGDKVVVIVKQTDLKHEATVVETTYRGNYLKVREVNGNWLWVDCNGTRGWIQRDHVILASRALDHFTDELRRNPKDMGALIARAQAWEKKGELTNAIRDCTDAIAINPKHEWAYKIRGNAWLVKQEYDLAIADYDEGMRLAPKDNDFHNNRGLCHHIKKNYDKAIADFTEAIRLNPKSALTFDNRGDSYCYKEQYDKALSDYTMAIELDPKLVSAYRGRARIYKERSEYTKSLADREAVLSLSPMDAMAHNSVAWFLATCPSDAHRNGTRAVELATKAVGLEKDKATKVAYLDTLAAAYAEVGDFSKAVETQQLALVDSDAVHKTELEEHLKLFQAGQPYRELPKTEAVAATAAK